MPTPPYTQIYDLEYFNGSQVFLYIGDVWVDEITSLQYQTSQGKTPLYGYASQLCDDITKGHVLVQGSFTINFKEQGYLWAVLRRYFEVSEISAGIQIKGVPAEKKQKRRDAALFKRNETLGNRPLVGSNGIQISRASVERLVQGEATRGERYNFYSDLAGYATFQTDSPKDKIFEDIVEVFEDQVWNKDISNQGLNSQLRRADDNRFDNFDMYVVFGNYANPKANHTVQKIIGVHLTSQGKMINIDGMPIQEQYSFLARTVA
jgi:hypothetical protein